MKITVDRKACLKSGQCTYLHPRLFAEDPSGFPTVLLDPVPGELRQEAEDAAEVCPSQAIILKE